MSSVLRRKATKLVQSVQGGTDRWVSLIKSTAFRVLTVLVLGTLQLWLSLFLYGSFYYAYMPTVTHISPVYLQFSHCKEFGPHTQCPFPNVNTSLLKSADMGSLLMRGQKYRIHLDLEMPRSPVNENQGIFMVRLNLYANGGEIVASSSRPAMMHYQSHLLKTAQILLFMPLLLTGYSEEKQTIVVSLMENFYDNPYKPVVGAHIELQARQLHIYSSVLRIQAYFTGLRYLMYQWPLSTAVVFVSTFFLFLCLISVVSWQQCARAFSSSPQEEIVVRMEDVHSMSYPERRQVVKKRMALERAALLKNRPKHVTVVGQEGTIPDDQESQSSGISSVDATDEQASGSALIETIKASHRDRLSDGGSEVTTGREHDDNDDGRVSSTSDSKVGKSQLEELAAENQGNIDEICERENGETVDRDSESEDFEDQCEMFEEAVNGPVVLDGEELRKRKQETELL